ncbi:MAG TPA: sulfite dehydrogenase, partial [Candidatus Glassbacteria bacterium]|nr:sulfite dehydrogenase [Candidatus Glassbacteria bacterium]
VLGERSRFENAGRLLGLFGPRTPLQDSVGIITPSALHFMAAHGYDPPDLDPRQHRLLIHGLVDRPLIFTLEDLKCLPSVSRIHFLECGGNTTPSTWKSRDATVQETHGYTGCSEWTGVPLSVLLQEAGLQKGAGWLVAEGAEPGKHAKSFPMEKVMADVLVAYGQNGEALRPEQGYPFRLVVPGWVGINNVKWLRRIKVVDQFYSTKWETAGYANMRRDGKAHRQLEMGPKSVITRPSGGQRLPGRGFYEITGLAWSGWGAIRRVEVSTDGGRTWKDAHLQEPVHRMAHARFRFPWTWNGEEAVLQSRSTDELGQVQPTLAEFSGIWGVNLDFWLSTSGHVINNFNPIQP